MLPKFIILTALPANVCNKMIYVDNEKNIRHTLQVDMNTVEGLFDSRAKIEVEPEPESDLRFCHNNRYVGVDAEKHILVATSDKRINTTSDPLCTLFDATVESSEENKLVLKHVSSSLYVQWDIDSLELTKEYPRVMLSFVDCDTVVKMPEHVAFKSHNKKYLQKRSEDSSLKFASDDPNDQRAGFRIKRRADGYIRIMDCDGKFWKVDGKKNPDTWVYSNQEDDPNAGDDAFWAVKIDSNTIALRSAANGLFCKRLWPEDESMKDCLSASSPNITKETRLEVKELVRQRSVYDVNYMLKDGRTINEKPYLSGITIVTNRSDKDDSVAVEITHQDEETYTFSRQDSDTLGLSTSFKAGVPFITDAGIQVSYERTATFQWDNTTTTTTSVKVTDTVPVPAESKAEVHYVGTVGTCSVPFSYTQHDLMPNGKTRTTKHTDGICTGVNSYNFKFQVNKTQPLHPALQNKSTSGPLPDQVPVKKN